MKVVALVLGVWLVALGIGQDQFPEVPIDYRQTDAVPIVIGELFRTGVLTDSYLDDLKPRTRYEEAVYLYAGYRSMIDPKVKRRVGPRYGDLLAKLKRCAAGREKELASLGVDVEAMKKHLRALAIGEGFPDVPPTHWASKATLELKALGLLKGYPDGLFRGD